MKKKNTTDKDIEKSKAEPKAANYRMTRAARREAADDFWKKTGSSLEAKIASGFTEELAIRQAEMIQTELGETAEESRQRIAINKAHDDIYGK